MFDHLQLTGIEISPAFICCCSSHSDEFGPPPAKVMRLSSDNVSEHGPRTIHGHSASAFLFEKKLFLCCSITEKSIGAATRQHTMWLDTPATEEDKPSLPKLLTYKVPQKVGVKYAGFGCLLLNNDDGSIIEAMEHDCQGICERIVHKTLSEWLKGKGKPVTWEVLIDTLRVCELILLADSIQEKM